MTTNLSRLALVLGLGLLPLLAQPGPGPKHSPRPGAMQGRMLDRMAERLKLTEDQKTRIQEIHRKHQDANQAKAKATQEARRTFHEASRNPATPVADLKALHQKVSDLAFDQMLARRAIHEEVQAVLTPEQRAEAEKMRAFHQGMAMGRKGGRRGHGGPGGPGF